jgi:uncharacterized phage-associated protein
MPGGLDYIGFRSFDFDAQKFVNAAAYLAEHCQDLTRMKLAKLLYFADKEHLRSYGRPVIGDRYIKMEYGPVPSRAYDMIKHDERVDVEAQGLFDRHFEVVGNDMKLRTPADLAYLSETDREVLDEVLSKYGHITSAQLSKLSHREPAWEKAAMNSPMDYRLFLAGDEEMGNLVQEDQELRDALEEIEMEEFLESISLPT